MKNILVFIFLFCFSLSYSQNDTVNYIINPHTFRLDGIRNSFTNLKLNKLTINDYTFPTSDGLNMQIIKTDGSGTLDWIDVEQAYSFKYDSILVYLLIADSIGREGTCVQKAYLDTIIGCSPVTFPSGVNVLYEDKKLAYRDSIYLTGDTAYTSTDTNTATITDTVYQGGSLWVVDYHDVPVRVNNNYIIDTSSTSFNCSSSYANYTKSCGSGDTSVSAISVAPSDTTFLYYCPSGTVTDSVVIVSDGSNFSAVCETIPFWIYLAGDAITHYIKYKQIFEHLRTGIMYRTNAETLVTKNINP